MLERKIELSQSKEKVTYLNYQYVHLIKYLKKEFSSSYSLVISGIRENYRESKDFFKYFY